VGPIYVAWLFRSHHFWYNVNAAYISSKMLSTRNTPFEVYHKPGKQRIVCSLIKLELVSADIVYPTAVVEVHCTLQY